MLLSEFLKKNKPELKFQEVAGGSELLLNCKQNECKTHTKPTLYINNYTGFYYCHRCSKRGRMTFEGAQLTEDHSDNSEPVTGRLDKEYVDALHSAISLPIGKPGREYLYSRGFNDEQILNYKLGYSPSLNAVSIPNLDHNGKAISLKYRLLDENAPYKYTQEALGGQAQLPYGIWLLNDTDRSELHITEAELDAISLKQILGNAQVLGLPGKNAFPRDRKDDKTGILSFLKDYNKIYLYPDREIRAILDFTKHADVLGSARCTVVRIPDGFKDLNDMLIHKATKEDIFKIISNCENKQPTTSYDRANTRWTTSITQLNEIDTKKKFSSGLPDLDEALNGMRPGELTIIAGEAGSGKTTLATQILYDAWKQGAVPVMGSYEMPINLAVIPRLSSLYYNKNVFLQPSRLLKSAEPPILKDLFFISPDTMIITTDMVFNHLQELYNKEKLETNDLVMLVVDNLSRFRAPPNLKIQEYLKWEEEQIIKIKNWTRRFPNLHIVLLAHLNKSQDNGMTKNRIRGSAVIAAEADNILLLSSSDPGKNVSKLIADKVRSMSGNRDRLIKLSYDHKTTRLTSFNDEEY